MAVKYPLSFVISAVDKATANLRRINRQMREMTQPIRVPLQRLGNRLTALSKEAGLPKLADRFQQARKSMEAVTRSAADLGKKLAGVALVAGGVGVALVAATIKAGDRLGEVSQRVGLTANAFAQLEFAAAQADVTSEQFGSAMDKLNRNLGDLRAGTGETLSFLQRVSPTLLRQLRGAKNTEAAVSILSGAFVRLKDPAKKAALAAAAFGRSGAQMGQFLSQGSAAIDTMRARYLALAGDQSKFADRTGQVDNALRETKTAFDGVRNAVVIGLLPAISKIAVALAEFMAKHREGLAAWAEKTGAAISKWVEGGGLQRLGESLANIAATVSSVVDRLGGLRGVALIVAGVLGAQLAVSVSGLIGSLWQLGGSLATVAVRLGGLLFGPVVAAITTFIGAIAAGTGVMGAFNAVLLANPIGLIILAVVALAGVVYLVYKKWKPIVAFFKRIWGMVVESHVQAWTSIRDFFSRLWDDIVGFFQDAWKKIEPIVDVMMQVAKFTPLGLAVESSKAAVNWWNSNGQAPINPAAALPPSGGETRVVVDFANAPKGMRVTPDPGGSAPLDFSVGYSMVGVAQ